VLTKQEVIFSLFSPAYDIDSFENTDIDVRVYGDAAVVVARGIVGGRYNGQDASGQFRYTRVWAQRGGRWYAVAAHSSMLPPPTGR
jgi:ketosteroid isomerase-like protein